MTPIFSFVSHKGGVGKSSLAYAVAWELQRRHNGPALIVDLDAPQFSVARMATRARDEGYTPPQVLRPNSLNLRETLPRMAPDYVAIVIDTPGRLGPQQLAAMLASHAVFVPVVFGQMNTDAAAQTLRELVEARRMRRGIRAAFILNQQAPRSEVSTLARSCVAKMKMPAKLPILRTEIFFRTAWRNADAAALALGVQDPWCRASEEMRALTDNIEEFLLGSHLGDVRAGTAERDAASSPKTKATLYFPAKLHKQMKVWCAAHETSLSGLATDLVRRNIASR